MKDKTNQRPTAAELEILQILWKQGPATVRFVNDKLKEKKEVGYTTTLKIMQIMTQKKMLKRNEKRRSHVYEAAVKEKDTINLMLDRFLDSVFNGSSAKLVMQALGNHKASREEISQIKKYLDTLEGEKK